MDVERFMELRKLKMKKRRKHILLYIKLFLTAILVLLGFLVCLFFTKGIIIGAAGITIYIVGVFAVVWTETVKDENGKRRLFGNCSVLSGDDYHKCMNANEYITTWIILKSMLILALAMGVELGLMGLMGVA